MPPEAVAPPTGDAPPATPAPPAPTTGETPKVEPTDLTGLKSALESERKSRRDAEARAKELEPYEAKAREAEEAGKSELTKANDALAASERARTTAETALLRYQVGADKGVPPNLVRFLTGDTKAAIEEAADELLKELNGDESRPKVPGRPTERMSSGKPSTGLDDEDPMALIAKGRGQAPPK